MAEGFGSSVWWGFSSAFDLLSEGLQSTPKVMNILLMGAVDLRHVLKTVASARVKKANVQFEFYVIEGHLECIARHMLFLHLLSQPKDKHGLREKSELFLEIYGNSLIRSQTNEYVTEVANDLIKMTTDPDYLQSTLPVLDISMLKFKERDMLEGIFKFWRNSDEKLFSMKEQWDARLRHHLGQRYDARSGVFDWDYHMKLEEIAPLIGGREYKEWREVGVAFKMRDDAPYQHSNKTLASGMIVKQSGESVSRRGYYGDIVTSPYVAFGTQCDNKDMIKKANGKFVKSCQEICEYNIQTLINLSVYGTPPPSSASNGGGSSLEDVIIEEVNEQDTPPDGGSLLEGICKIHFLPLLFANDLPKKAKFKKFFDCAYFSNSMVHNLAVPGLESVLADDSTLVCETARYMLDLKKDHLQLYTDKVKGMAKSIGFSVKTELLSENALIVFTRTPISS